MTVPRILNTSEPSHRCAKSVAQNKYYHGETESHQGAIDRLPWPGFRSFSFMQPKGWTRGAQNYRSSLETVEFDQELFFKVV
jgi:hypothetical protein